MNTLSVLIWLADTLPSLSGALSFILGVIILASTIGLVVACCISLYQSQSYIVYS